MRGTESSCTYAQAVASTHARGALGDKMLVQCAGPDAPSTHPEEGAHGVDICLTGPTQRKAGSKGGRPAGRVRGQQEG